ncbi:MAG: ABC transporter ATP-binding protein [Sphingomonadales bacterium]
MTATETAPDNAIEIRGLRKRYRGGKGFRPHEALKGIDLDIPRGAFFGLLGPNGAGKSTLINILAGLVNKTEGEVRIWGFDIDRQPRAARASIGVVPQEISFDAFFTPREALELQAGLYGVPKAERRTDAILAAMHLTDKANAYARALSGGMKRRLLVAKAMVHSPPILVLDEPTAGVDIELRQQLWEHIEALKSGGVTIMLTTHYLEEAERLCDRIAIIDQGQVVANEPTQKLLQRIDERELVLRLDRPVDAVPEALRGFQTKTLADNELCVRYSASLHDVDEVLGAVHGAGYAIVDLTMRETDLEDVFISLTSRK